VRVEGVGDAPEQAGGDQDSEVLHRVDGDTRLEPTGADREVRVTRYSPTGARSREQALFEMSDADLARLLVHSQSSEMSPEAGYRS